MGEHVFDKYLRTEAIPSIWCAGCGNGIVTQCMFRAIDELGLDKTRTVMIAGIGCSSRANGYLQFPGMHTAHGRALAFATGVKMANPDLDVIVVTGDGDCASIGGNHFIHACRRNIDLTVVIYNNSNYGMTGGQFSPTTPFDAITATTAYGNIDEPADLCKIAEAAGATYVARSTTYHVKQLTSLIKKGIEHKGLSVIDAACDCPSLYGRLNKMGSPADMIRRWKDCTVSVDAAKKMTAEELAGKVIIGEFVNRNDKPEYTESYLKLIESVKEA